MYPGIRSAGSFQDDGLSGNPRKHPLDFRLNGGLSYLSLPAEVSGTVIFYDKFEISIHSAGITTDRTGYCPMHLQRRHPYPE
jgi:hypothetical protein